MADIYTERQLAYQNKKRKEANELLDIVMDVMHEDWWNGMAVNRQSVVIFAFSKKLLSHDEFRLIMDYADL